MKLLTFRKTERRIKHFKIIFVIFTYYWEYYTALHNSNTHRDRYYKLNCNFNLRWVHLQGPFLHTKLLSSGSRGLLPHRRLHVSQAVCDVSQPSAGVRAQQGSVREPSALTGHWAAVGRGAGAGQTGRDGAPQNSGAGGETADVDKGSVEAVAAALLRDLPFLLLRGEQPHVCSSRVKRWTPQKKNIHKDNCTFFSQLQVYIPPFILFCLAVLTFFLRIASYKTAIVSFYILQFWLQGLHLAFLTFSDNLSLNIKILTFFLRIASLSQLQAINS